MTVDPTEALEALKLVDSRQAARGVPIAPHVVAKELDCTERDLLRALDKHVLAGAVELLPARAAGGRDDVLLRLVPWTSRTRR